MDSQKTPNLQEIVQKAREAADAAKASTGDMDALAEEVAHETALEVAGKAADIVDLVSPSKVSVSLGPPPVDRPLPPYKHQTTRESVSKPPIRLNLVNSPVMAASNIARLDEALSRVSGPVAAGWHVMALHHEAAASAALEGVFAGVSARSIYLKNRGILDNPGDEDEVYKHQGWANLHYHAISQIAKARSLRQVGEIVSAVAREDLVPTDQSGAREVFRAAYQQILQEKTDPITATGQLIGALVDEGYPVWAYALGCFWLRRSGLSQRFLPIVATGIDPRIVPHSKRLIEEIPRSLSNGAHDGFLALERLEMAEIQLAGLTSHHRSSNNMKPVGDYLLTHCGANTQEITEKLGISRPAALRAFDSLTEAGFCLEVTERSHSRYWMIRGFF